MSSAPQAFKVAYGELRDGTDDLLSRFLSPLPPDPPYSQTCPPVHEDGQSLLIIKLQNHWGAFCHTLVLLSAEGGHRTLGGRLVSQISGIPPSLPVSTHVKKVALAVAKSQGKNGPVWHSCVFTVDVANALGVVNAKELFLGMSPNITAGWVNKVRNYVVHPATSTKADYMRVTNALGMPGAGVSQLLASVQPGGATVFEYWVRDLQRTAFSSAQ